MIDLKPSIRKFILADDVVPPLLAPYLDTRAVHTRRPLPKPAPGQSPAELYPVIAVSSQIGRDGETDLIDAPRRVLTHYISIYGTNATPDDYRVLNRIAFRLAEIFNRPDTTAFEGPFQLVDAVAYGPTDAPTDDDALIGFVVAVQFTVLVRR